MTTFCATCGKELPSDWNFPRCPYCGNELPKLSDDNSEDGNRLIVGDANALKGNDITDEIRSLKSKKIEELGFLRAHKNDSTEAKKKWRKAVEDVKELDGAIRKGVKHLADLRETIKYNTSLLKEVDNELGSSTGQIPKIEKRETIKGVGNANGGVSEMIVQSKENTETTTTIIQDLNIDELRVLSETQISSLKKKANDGDHDAQYQYGMSLLYGGGGICDPQSATDYLEQAAESDNEMPLAALSMILDNGFNNGFNFSRSIMIMASLYDIVYPVKDAVKPKEKGEEAKKRLVKDYPKVRNMIAEIIGSSDFVTFNNKQFCFPWKENTFSNLIKGLENTIPSVLNMQQLLKAGVKGNDDSDGYAMFIVEDMLVMPLEILKALAGRWIAYKLLKERGYSVPLPNKWTNQILGSLLIDDDDASDNDYIIGGLRKLAGHDGDARWQWRTALWYEYDKETRELGEAEYWYRLASSQIEPASKALDRVRERLEYKMEREKKVGTGSDAMSMMMSYSSNAEMKTTWVIEAALRGKDMMLDKLAKPYYSSTNSIKGKEIKVDEPYYKYLKREKDDAQKEETAWIKMMEDEQNNWADNVRKRKEEEKNAQECRKIIGQIESQKQKISVLYDEWKEKNTEKKAEEDKRLALDCIKELRNPTNNDYSEWWKIFFFVDEPQLVLLKELDGEAADLKRLMEDFEKYSDRIEEYKKKSDHMDYSEREIDKKILLNICESLESSLDNIRTAKNNAEHYADHVNKKLVDLKSRDNTRQKKFSPVRSTIVVLVVASLIKFCIGLITDQLDSSSHDEEDTVTSLFEAGKSNFSNESYDMNSEKSENKLAGNNGDSETISNGNNEQDVREQLKNQFDYVSSFDSDGLARIEKGGKKGIANTNGKILIEPRYDYISSFDRDGWARVEIGDKRGFIVQKNGKIREIVKPKYTYIYSFDDDGWAKVEIGEKKGFIDRSGREVVPCVYDYISYFTSGYAEVEKDGKKGYLNRNGKVTWSMTQ